jgi:hypothetical protein
LTERLVLKWGSLKAWKFTEGSLAHGAFKRYFEAGNVMASAMMQHDNAEQKKAICEIIDALDNDHIWNDWSGEKMSKEAAKDYVLNYGR